MTLSLDRQGLPSVVVRGTSRRWYRVGLHAHYVEDYVDVNGEFREVKEVLWRTNIDAGAWKQDITERTPFAVALCMHPTQRSQNLPIGDQVAALALALQNDKTTAMRIPLLAQFIVSPREALEDVYQFSEDGVIMTTKFTTRTTRPLTCTTSLMSSANRSWTLHSGRSPNSSPLAL